MRIAWISLSLPALYLYSLDLKSALKLELLPESALLKGGINLVHLGYLRNISYKLQ